MTKYGFEELQGDKEKWFDTVQEAREWASSHDFQDWQGRSGMKKKEGSGLSFILRNYFSFFSLVFVDVWPMWAVVTVFFSA